MTEIQELSIEELNLVAGGSGYISASGRSGYISASGRTEEPDGGGTVSGS